VRGTDELRAEPWHKYMFVVQGRDTFLVPRRHVEGDSHQKEVVVGRLDHHVLAESTDALVMRQFLGVMASV
jgi:hypothetical protein